MIVVSIYKNRDRPTLEPVRLLCLGGREPLVDELLDVSAADPFLPDRQHFAGLWLRAGEHDDLDVRILARDFGRLMPQLLGEQRERPRPARLTREKCERRFDLGEDFGQERRLGRVVLEFAVEKTLPALGERDIRRGLSKSPSRHEGDPCCGTSHDVTPLASVDSSARNLSAQDSTTPMSMRQQYHFPLLPLLYPATLMHRALD